MDANDSEDLSKLSVALLICWQIWKMRNQVAFHNAKPYPSRVGHLALSLGKDYVNANKSLSIAKNNSKRIIRWIPPREGFCKINFDGSIKDSMAAAGFVLRDVCSVPVVAGA